MKSHCTGTNKGRQWKYVAVGARRKQTTSLMCVGVPTRRADLYKRIDWISAAQSARMWFNRRYTEYRDRSVSGNPRCNLHVSAATSSLPLSLSFSLSFSLFFSLSHLRSSSNSYYPRLLCNSAAFPLDRQTGINYN